MLREALRPGFYQNYGLIFTNYGLVFTKTTAWFLPIDGLVFTNDGLVFTKIYGQVFTKK